MVDAEDLDEKVKELATRLMEKELFEEIGRISSELAHDLRSPIQTIRNCVYLLEQDPEDLSPLAQINDAVRYASSILDGFREFYRGHEIFRSKTPFNSIVEHALIDVEIPSGVKVKMSLDPEIGDVSVDPTKMRRVFYNLIKNAVEAMPDGGNLTIETQDMSENIVAIVSDTGTGIPEDVRDGLFKPFGSKKRDGNGLGLPSCRRIVVAHGGEISFESGDGRGTAFTVVIPKISDT
jgi:signal transduction histidine kinase